MRKLARSVEKVVITSFLISISSLFIVAIEHAANVARRSV
jgi:hypothetical protein